MDEPMRVPMKSIPRILTEDELQASITRGPNVGRRFTMDVSEEALAQMGREALPFIAQKLADNAVHRNAHVIESEVRKLLYDNREWLDKIVQDETRRVVRAFMKDTLAGWMERMEHNFCFWRELATRYAMLDDDENLAADEPTSAHPGGTP